MQSLSTLDFRRLFDASPAMRLVLTRELLVAAASDAFLRETRSARDAVIGRHVLDVLPDGARGDEADVRAFFDHVLARKEPGTLGVARRRVGGSASAGAGVERWWRASSTPLLDERGEVEWILHEIEDVTDAVRARGAGPDRAGRASPTEVELRLRAEEAQEASARLAESEAQAQRALRAAEEASRLKDEFLATVSHELRTPLTSILGWARILTSKEVEPATLRRGLETIERNARSQAQLIDDLLDVSRIISGKLHIAPRKLDVAACLHAAAAIIRPAAEAKRVSVNIHIDPGAGSIVADEERLQQVVWNLLSNAMKFTPSGGRIDLRAAREGGQVRIVVEDTGRGIPPEFRPYVFDRFRQAEGASTRKHGGLGLGLAIVRHLVEAHGGTVSAESEGTGKGARFTVLLPVRAAESPNEFPAESPTSAGGARPAEPTVGLQGLRVLLVDDEPDAREVLTLILERAGARVTGVGSAGDALRALEPGAVDVVVSDIAMPHEDGYQLVERIRAREVAAGVARTPALALTAYARAEDADRAVVAGFDEHVAKPVEPAQLVGTVARLTRGRVGVAG